MDLERIVELMQARLEGRINNEQVERAVQAFLSQPPPVPVPSLVPPLLLPSSQQPQSTTPSSWATTAAAAAAAAAASTSSAASSTPTTATAREEATATNNSNSCHVLVHLDTENYDDDDDDEGDDDDDPVEQGGVESLLPPSHHQAQSQEETDNTTPLSRRKRKATTTRSSKPKKSDLGRKAAATAAAFEIDWSVYADIPLGKQGAQMMLTFGDGPNPHPLAVSAALLGARRMIQVAIQDARQLRRQQKRIYTDVQQAHNRNKPQKPQYSGQWSTELLYRAYEGKDHLSANPKCGFTLEDLQQLFPEEMNAYLRWDAMHAEYAEKQQQQQQQQSNVAASAATVTAEPEGDNKSDGGTDGNNPTHPTPKEAKHPREVESTVNHSAVAATAAVQADGGGDDGERHDDDNGDDDVALVGGYLQERAAQFDVRTDRMKRDWYMAFADVRQGSFISRRFGSRASEDEERWESQRTQRTRGGQEQGVWGHMSASVVRFLHWVGFNPDSLLPPPPEPTVHALGYVAYSFFGRIVEKAIELRNRDKLQQQQRQQAGANLDEMEDDVAVRELEPGEQLQDIDIARAMADPDIKPVPLFGSNRDEMKPQLYFGPGFEDRLELELEQLAPVQAAGPGSNIKRRGRSAIAALSTNTTIRSDEEELQAQGNDEELFARLAEPPRSEAFAEFLLERQTEGPTTTSSRSKPPTRMAEEEKDNEDETDDEEEDRPASKRVHF